MINRHQSQPIRSGALASFPNLETLGQGFEQVASMLPVFDVTEFSQRYGSTEPPNVLNLALRIFDEADDMPETEWSTKISAFINERQTTLHQRGVRRVSVLICRPEQYPWYYTLREMDGVWQEEQAIRNIEPALAFQLELSRLSNYNLTIPRVH